MNIIDLLKGKDKIMKIYEKALLKKNLNLAKQLIPIINDPRTTYDFVIFYNKGNYEKSWESIVFNSPQYACLWAKDILKTRWKEAEPVISQSPWYSYIYAHDVLKDRFLLGEKSILTDPLIAYSYAYSVIKNRWEEAEPIIAKNPQSAFYYAHQVLNDRFVEGEEAIAQDADNAFFYARDILKSRFKIAEEKIIQNKRILKEYLVILKRFNLLNEFLKDYPTLDISNYINEIDM
jgi:hypothetical protein